MVDTTDTTPDDDGPSPEDMATTLDVAKLTIANYLRAELPDAVPADGIAADIAQRLLDVGVLAHDGQCLRLPDDVTTDVSHYRAALQSPFAVDMTETCYRVADSTLTLQVDQVRPDGLLDIELTTMAALVVLLGQLAPDVRQRAASWALERFGLYAYTRSTTTDIVTEVSTEHG